MKLYPGLVFGFVFLAACDVESTGPVSSAAPDFSVTQLAIAPLQTRNLCSQIGGQGVQPQLTISHTAVAGVPLRVRMYDVHDNGRITEHNTVRAVSEADGTTTVASGFRPPCNTTGGRVSSSYRFDVTAQGRKTTTQWGDYDSGAGVIR